MPRGFQVEPLIWSDFREWFQTDIEPGQHGAIVSPTGSGKTVFAGGLLDLRRYVLAIDPKGGDSSLERLGYERLDTWPGERRMTAKIRKNDEEGLPSRYVVGPKVRRHEDTERLGDVIRDTLRGAYSMGGWTVYVDELQLATDPRLGINVRKEVDQMLIAARDRGLSCWTSYQSPSWVTPHASRMATWMAVSYTRDREAIRSLAGNLGRPVNEVAGMIAGLDPYAFAIVTRDPKAPVRVTIADYFS
jgi:hypothetical protein